MGSSTNSNNFKVNKIRPTQLLKNSTILVSKMKLNAILKKSSQSFKDKILNSHLCVILEERKKKEKIILK